MPGAAYREFNFGLGESIDAVRDQAGDGADWIKLYTDCHRSKS